MESDRGARPAALVSPVSLAPQRLVEGRAHGDTNWRSMTFAAAECEVTDGSGGDVVLPDDEADAGAAAEIDATFRRKLAAIRRMPPRDRPFARRTAMDERVSALHALQRKQEAARRFRHFLRRLLAPPPQK